MQNKKLFLSLYFIITVICAQAAWADTKALSDNAEKIFNAEHTILNNGMEIVLIPNHRAPVVTHMVWYKIGSADEAWGKSGIAHFLEHLMFKGSENVPSGMFSKRVKGLGGRDNAFTSYDYTAYFQSVPVEHLETVMRMEADRMKGLLLEEQDVLAERDVVIEERRQNTENDPEALFSEQLMSALYVNHPYGRPVIGWNSEISALSVSDAHAWHNTYYAPNNAIMVVSGDIEMDELVSMASEIYGIIPASDVEIIERNWSSVPNFNGKSTFELNDPSLRQSSLRRLYRVPSLRQNRQDALALQVLESILGDGAATRLYRNLVVDQKLATNVNLGYYGDSYSDAKIWVIAYPADGTELSMLENAIDDILRDVIDSGVTDDELATAKQRMKDQAVFARDSLRGPAMIFGRMLATGAALDDVEYWPHYIDAVSAADVQRVANEYLNPDTEISSAEKTVHYVTGYIHATPLRSVKDED